MPETLNLPYAEAAAVVEDQALDFLLKHRDPVKTTDLLPAVSVGPLTPRSIRGILTQSRKFVSVNRKWDVALRHSGAGLTIDRAVDSLLIAYGRPMSTHAIAAELSIIMERPAEAFESVIPRFLSDRPRYVPLSDGLWARQEWMLMLAGSEDDILFENFFMSPEEEELEALRPAADRFKWDTSRLSESAMQFVNTLSTSISNRVLSFFVWKEAPQDFKPVEFFEQMRSRPGGLLLAGCRWCPAALRKHFDQVYQEIGQREDEVPAEDAEAITVEQPPLTLDPDDLEQVFGIVSGSDRSWRVPELVETAFDITEGDRGYEEAVHQLNMMMVDDERFLWVGTDRWREASSLPEFVFDVPEPLTIQQFIFEDENQEPIDVELDDKGIDEGLLQAMSSLLAQDFGDREPAPEGAGDDLTTFDFWLLRHHRETGTLAVLPAFRGFFPPAPDVIEVMVTTNTGQRFPVWLNDTLETLFGFGRWFVESDLPLSGAMFTLSKTHVPGEYRLDYSGAMEPRLTIDPERMEELDELQLEAEGDTPLPTFDIMRNVMQKFGQKGAPFVRIWAEVNVVRRTTRRMLASLLSAYQCFVPVARGGDVWWYDEKRMPLGINKQKRKFIRSVD